jgi:hypothetical protein
MENNQAPQEVSTEVKQTFSKILFPTELRCFSYGLTEELQQSLIDLNQSQTEDVELMSLDHPTIDRFKEVVYDICQQLEEFQPKSTEGLQEGENVNYLPQIIGSNILFQQAKEHIPLHAYEHVPLVLTFVLNTGQYPQFTYFADTRGGVQTIRQKVYQNLVGTSFGIRGQLGECFVTPGYVQRYTETNLSDQAQVFFNVLVGFTNY